MRMCVCVCVCVCVYTHTHMHRHRNLHKYVGIHSIMHLVSIKDLEVLSIKNSAHHSTSEVHKYGLHQN